jgi:hypothetical protein
LNSKRFIVGRDIWDDSIPIDHDEEMSLSSYPKLNLHDEANSNVTAVQPKLYTYHEEQPLYKVFFASQETVENIPNKQYNSIATDPLCPKPAINLEELLDWYKQYEEQVTYKNAQYNNKGSNMTHVDGLLYLSEKTLPDTIYQETPDPKILTNMYWNCSRCNMCMEKTTTECSGCK